MYGKLIYEGVNAFGLLHRADATSTTSGCSPECQGRLDRIDAILNRIGFQLQSLQTSQGQIRETLEHELEANKPKLLERLGRIEQNQSGYDTALEEVGNRIHLLTKDVDDIFERVTGPTTRTQDQSNASSVIQKYENGTIDVLTREQLAFIVQKQGGATDVSRLSEDEITTLLLEYIRDGIRSSSLTRVPTSILDLVVGDECVQKRNIISEFLRIVEESPPDGSVTMYPCELLEFLFQFKSVNGDHVLKALT